MASDIVSLEIKGEGDSISPGRQPPPQNIIDTDSSPENTENPVSNRKQLTHIISGLANISLSISLLRALSRSDFVLVCMSLVLIAFMPVITVVMLPLFFVSIVVLRLFELIGSSKNLEKRLLTKKFLCLFMMSYLLWSLMVISVFYYPIVKNVPWVKHVMIIGLPLTKWFHIICKLVGIFGLSQAVSYVLDFLSTQLILEKSESKLILSEAMSEIIGCLLFLWAELLVMRRVPTFKQSKIAGIYTHNWIEVSLFLIIGYNIITFLIHALVWSLLEIYTANEGDVRSDIKSNNAMRLYWGKELGKAFNKKYVVYIAFCIKRCIISLLSMVMLLITWVVYFVSRLDETPEDKKNLEFGTWTIVSVLLCSFLWLIKSCILLYWEAYMYDRLHSKIMGIGELLYFLIMLTCTHYRKTVDGVESNKITGKYHCNFERYRLVKLTQPNESKALWVLSVNNNENEEDLMLNRKSVREELINYPRSSIYDLKTAAQRLLTAQYALSKETTLGDLDHLQVDDSGVDNAKCREVLKKVVQVEGDTNFDDDWKMLLKLLPGVTTEEDITLDKVKTFMERAHSRCIFLVDTLISEHEMVKCLNQVISWLIIVVTIITWLLLTGLASTKVFVLIASPVLAVTFIFGDTAKSLFQGLIFVYVVHPFDVGDLCIIDEKLLEVKRIGVWSTTFSKVRTLGKQHQVIYPNSVLAEKNVINHETIFDWDDNIEFLCLPEANITEPLKKIIERYLDDAKDKFTPKFRSVEILEMGDKAKIVVHVKHKLLKTTEGWTYFECLKKKEKRRFKLAIHVQKLLKRVESKANTSEMEDFFTRG
ncbi:mechanosensitive ion channel protein 10-like [Silene latifolia]|uniref:mechanosensitive ion channel protein 10-like n=1 Tax=Silene latifolia TaxID=37657 RepID=UPI003D773870